MQRKRSDIERALPRKGFTLVETHHRLYKLFIDGRYTGIHTFISTGTKYKEYDNNLLGKMARQLRLSKRELCDLIDCPMDAEHYIARLQEQNAY